MDVGLLTLGELNPDPTTGVPISEQQRIHEILRSASLADEVGFAAFATGEHHSPSYLGTTPTVLLSAVAARTERIRLRSGLTLLPSRDPVLLAEDFATLDHISNGRADIVVGKGIYPEPLEIFGPDKDLVDEVYYEKIDLLLRLLRETDVTWSGDHRGPLVGVTTRPRPLQDPFPVWLGVSGSERSLVFAGERGLSVMFGGLFQTPSHYAGLLEVYRRAAADAGQDLSRALVATTSHAHVARRSQDAKRRWRPYHSNYFQSNRGRSSREVNLPPWEELTGPTGLALCGSPAEIVDRLSEMRETLGHDLHFLQLDLGGLPWPLLAESIELIGSEVIPALASR
ncbi:LLM class flavin-dependent oxidoreductase [Frankia sp. QA3]|uniref:LLM class flavin-dependent oxidoreductase n=1 Tax=Frankia sp. QA3 TaxID=710111 RepID=UPI000269BDAF|nr:LLM class flavin-dependent oxidoreductase [Frankia sp. QA3]EIV91831.1 flavin-dependent oxidoreductase, F420-dependent methylene-tetrahydromethanopterin reductase [Frankia sp. QA3]